MGCGGHEVETVFEKHGFAYGLCQDCGTLYQTPRPPLSAFEAFYRDSVSSNFWAEVFFPVVAEARREKIIRPRCEHVLTRCKAKGLAIQRLIDVGAGYGIFLDEWRKHAPDTQLIAVEPSAALAKECRSKGFEVVESVVEQVGVRYECFADLVVCFEVLEHVYEPVAFVKSLMRLARPGGMVFVSTLCVDGFDLQTLWQKSNQIFPPHHVNFLSVSGFEKLFTRAGMKNITVITPGRLDVDIVRNAVHLDPNLLRGQRFLQRLIADEEIATSFQNFLAMNRLSSHAWVSGEVPSY